MASRHGALRSLLGLIAGGRAALRSPREGGHAFVSASLRAYVIAALAELDERARVTADAGGRRRRPRGARPGGRPARLAGAAARALLPLARRRLRVAPGAAAAPRRAARGGARRAARQREPRRGRPGEPPVVVVSAVALSEKVPDPALRPHSFTLRVGELLDLDECAAELVGAGYERVDQVEERGQFAMRGGLLDVFPATEERAVRVDMFDVEIESLRWFSTFTQRSLGEVEEVEIAPAAELAAEHRELAEIAAATGELAGAGGERAPSARTSPSCCRWSASARCSTCVGETTELLVAAEEELDAGAAATTGATCARRSATRTRTTCT